MQRIGRGKKKNSRRCHSTHTFMLKSPCTLVAGFRHFDILGYQTVKTNRF